MASVPTTADWGRSYLRTKAPRTAVRAITSLPSARY